MPQNTHAPPKWRVAMTWLLMLTIIIGVTGLVVWRNHVREPAAEDVPSFFRSIIMVGLGAFALVAGIAAYVVTLASDCFTFNFSGPIWKNLRGRIFLANIFVPMAPALGIGFMLSAAL